MKTTKISLLISVLLLAGCGGSGGDGTCASGEFCDISDDVEQTLDNAGFTELEGAGDISNADLVDFDDLPKTGDVSYEGFLALQLENDGELLIGLADIAASFGANAGSFAGSADGFVGESSGSYSGSLEITEGLIVKGADTFVDTVEDAVSAHTTVVAGSPPNGDNFAGIVSDLDGVLTSSSNVEISVDGNIVGTFSGEDAAMIGITIGETDQGVLSGIFVAVDTDTIP